MGSGPKGQVIPDPPQPPAPSPNETPQISQPLHFHPSPTNYTLYITEFLKIQKNGQFPDDLVIIEDTQIHCVVSQTYYVGIVSEYQG
jgi:hypothetical protein